MAAVGRECWSRSMRALCDEIGETVEMGGTGVRLVWDAIAR